MRSTLRWLIRSLCLLALAAVLAAWVTSYWAEVDLYRVQAGRDRCVGVVQGLCYMCRIDHFPVDRPLGLWGNRGGKAALSLPEEKTLGFYAGPVPYWPDSFRIDFPLWLPTLLLLGLNAFLWRKAFRRTPRGAFPIEPTAAPSEPSPAPSTTDRKSA